MNGKSNEIGLPAVQKKNGYYFCEHREGGDQHSLRTKDETEANLLLNARNEAEQTPGFALQIAKTYIAAADPKVAKRTWRYVADELIHTKHGENAVRWQRAVKDQAFARILDLPLIETRAEHFLGALKAGTVSTNVFLRRLHNFALGVGLAACAGARIAAKASRSAGEKLSEKHSISLGRNIVGFHVVSSFFFQMVMLIESHNAFKSGSSMPAR